jgi:hypothetical protein
MKLDIAVNEGVWFDCPGGGKVQLRSLSLSDVFRIEKESTENRPFLYQEEGKPPRVMNHEITDTDKRARLINDSTIVAWEGIVDANDNPIPCNAETKTALMRLPDSTFRDFIAEKLTLLDEATKGKGEEDIKNSLAG